MLAALFQLACKCCVAVLELSGTNINAYAGGLQIPALPHVRDISLNALRAKSEAFIQMLELVYSACKWVWCSLKSKATGCCCPLQASSDPE